MAEGGEGVAAAVAAAVELEILVGCPPPQGGVAGTLAGSNNNNTSSSNNTISLAQVEVAAVAGVRVGRTGSTDGRVAAVP